MSLLAKARDVLDRLDGRLSHGTRLRGVPWDSNKTDAVRWFHETAETPGTHGTGGTSKTVGTAARAETVSITVADLIDDYSERIAICAMDGISEEQAIQTADRQLGATLRTIINGSMNNEND